MENSKKRHLSGTVLAGAFAVPAAMSTAQQNVTSANLFTSLYSTASNFFTKKAGESTFSFLASRAIACIGITVVVVSLYKLYKYLLSSGEEKKEESISEKIKIIEKKNDPNGVKQNTAKKILKDVLEKREKYIKEVIEEKVKEFLKQDEVSKETVNIIYSKLDLKKFEKADLNLGSVIKEDKEENAKNDVVKILKDKIKEVYGKDIENILKNKMSKKIQAVYRDFIARKKQKEQQINEVYEKNKEFLENFKITSKQAAKFVEFSQKKDEAENEEKTDFVEVSAKVENNIIKVTFKKDNEEKTLNIEKSNEGLKRLKKIVELSKESIKREILALYRGYNEQLLKKFEIEKEQVGEFVDFNNKDIENKKVKVTSKSEDDKIIFTFTNEKEEKTLEIPVTNEGYSKLEKLLKLAKEYHKEKEKGENNENLEKNNVIEKKDENLEIFKMFRNKFYEKFGNLKNDTNGYLYITETKDNVIEVVYPGYWKKYPLSISYNNEKKEFNLKYKWTWAYGTLGTQEDKMIENASKAINDFLKQFATMYKSATGKDLFFSYNEEKKDIDIFDNKQKGSTEINDSANCNVNNN